MTFKKKGGEGITKSAHIGWVKKLHLAFTKNEDRKVLKVQRAVLIKDYEVLQSKTDAFSL